jgi:CRISPR-associated endonuclease Cas1/CRISPR-associated protein Cas4
MTDEYLWPARHIAEYAYCPRLFYFMEVEGVFAPSADTENGKAVHRRVDNPSQAPVDDAGDEGEEPEKPKSVRSLALTSRTLGLTATLDLAEITGNRAVPIEYRKGRPRHAPTDPAVEDPEADEPSLPSAEPWPTDRVQVGLQAILLEEEGYRVEEAVLYYAEEKRKVSIRVDEVLKSEARSALEAARDCAKGSRPLPLVNDSRCPGCSLLAICLPDEVNFERVGEGGDGPEPRKLWPPRDDGIQVVAQTEGSRIGVSGLSLKVTDRRGAKLREIPLANVESLALLGPVQITTQAVRVLADRNVPIAFLSAAGRLTAMVDPLDSVSARIRRAQVLRFEDPAVVLELSKALVTAKIVNQRTLLMRNHIDPPPDAARAMAEAAEKAGQAATVEELRGHEGQAAAVYFRNFAEFQENGRKRRPPPDPVNACLSFGYTMLAHECTAALRLARLEPSIGCFHTDRPGRPALALDLMEPFRALVADSVAVSAFNRGELGEGHFLRTSAGCAFTDSGRKAFFEAYGRRMAASVTHPVFGYRLSYRRMLTLHARLIAAWLEGEVPALSFLTTR